jgi:hypothetical protein
MTVTDPRRKNKRVTASSKVLQIVSRPVAGSRMLQKTFQIK